MRWYSSAVEIRSMITCLDVPENAPCRDHKLLCGGLAYHLSIPRLTTLIKSPRYRDVLNGKRVKDERTYCHVYQLRFVSPLATAIDFLIALVSNAET